MRPDDEFVCKSITGCAPSETQRLIAWYNATLMHHKCNPYLRVGDMHVYRLANRLRYHKALPEEVVTVLKIKLRYAYSKVTRTRRRELKRQIRERKKYKEQQYAFVR